MSFGDDILDKPSVVGRIGQRLVLNNETARQPADDLRADQTLAEMVIQLIGKTEGEYFLKVGGDICSGDGRRWLDDQWQRNAVTLCGEDEGVFDRQPGFHEHVTVRVGLDLRVGAEHVADCNTRLVLLDQVDDRF